MRRREHHAEPFVRALLEQFEYRRSIYSFIAQRQRNPDLVIDFDVRDDAVIFDVGAYLGQWSQRVLARSCATVYAFEPNPTVQARLHQQLDAFPTATILDYGLGAWDTQAPLTLSGPGSTLYADSSPHGDRTVEVRDILGVLDELELDHLDIMKLNIEGSEYDVLERLADTDWLPRIGVVLVQFHEWMPASHRRRRAIRRALHRSHRLVWDFPWVWEMWQQVPL